MPLRKRLRVIPILIADLHTEQPDVQMCWDREFFVQPGQRLRGYFIKTFDIGASHVTCH